MKLITTFSILLAFYGIHALETVSETSQTTFKLQATGSSASILLKPHYYGNGKPLPKMHTTFSHNLGDPEQCYEEGTDLCVKWYQNRNNNPEGSLTVKEISSQHLKDVTCHEYVTSISDDQEIETCHPLEGAQLYGGPITSSQNWPSQNNKKSNLHLVVGMRGTAGTVEPYWLTSSGNAIFVPPDVPLFISQNETELCLKSKVQDPYLPDDSGRLELKYVLCSSDNPASTHLAATRVNIPLPNEVPGELVFQHPIWSTWARYKKIINTSTVLDFGNQILYYGFNNSQLEIDDNWEPCYGEAEFDSQTFVDPKLMVQTLKEKGFHVTLWTHPFINVDCPIHDTAKKNDYLAWNADKTSTLTIWWDGTAGVVNFTNPEAVSWWKGRLQDLITKYDFDSFKFDAGECGYLPGAPHVGKLSGPIRMQPNIFTTEYVKIVTSVSEQKLAEVRVAYRNQEEPIFLRMSDKASTWGIGGGLKSVVTTLLAMNMVGYSFVLPDMVGGNGYGSNIPDKELFIRWLQANTFMPTIQFSYVPWDYDEETVKISKKFTALHYQYSDKILQLAAKKVADGTPINLPIWWHDHTDEEALKIDTEFLLGDDLLVAPILEQGALSRDIYLPVGKWQDELLPGVIHNGGTWLRNYVVQLDELAYFTRLPDETPNMLPTRPSSATSSALLCMLHQLFIYFAFLVT